jgi:hypothetical protein
LATSGLTRSRAEPAAPPHFPAAGHPPGGFFRCVPSTCDSGSLGITFGGSYSWTVAAVAMVGNSGTVRLTAVAINSTSSPITLASVPPQPVSTDLILLFGGYRGANTTTSMTINYGGGTLTTLQTIGVGGNGASGGIASVYGAWGTGTPTGYKFSYGAGSTSCGNTEIFAQVANGAPASSSGSTQIGGFLVGP